MFRLSYSQLCLLCAIIKYAPKISRDLNDNKDYHLLCSYFFDLYMIAENSDKVEFFLTK